LKCSRSSGSAIASPAERAFAYPVLLAVLETTARVPDRRLGAPQDRVHARDLPLAAGEVLGATLLGLAPVEPRRVSRVQHPVVVLPRRHKPPDLVEDVDAKSSVVGH
jgi:hypothetical protein